jgi:hypothetical protein
MTSSSRLRFKTVQLGTGLATADHFRAALKAADCGIAEHANEILGSFQPAATKAKVNLVVRSVADLGFRHAATYDELCSRARALGLELCPAEIGPQLRLQYRAQPYLHWLKIAMEPILHSSGRPVIFSVDSSFGARYLGTRYADDVWLSIDRFVFLDPRSAALR